MNKFFIAIVATIFLTFFAQAEAPKVKMSYLKIIEKVEVLTSEQKYQAALEYLNENIKKISEPYDQAQAIAKALQLEMALHGYETAVKDMKAKKWPQDLKSQLLLNTYYGRALQNYSNSYYWEISKREKTISNQNKDLKAWTTEEIFAAAYASYYAAWKNREKLNNVKKTELDNFIDANTYPDGVKDSMRDTLSYLFVTLLEDTTGWSPAAKNEIFKLNLKDLSEGKGVQENILTDEQAHPLQKITFILEDLRQWNEKKKNIQGALESQLELFRILHTHFSAEQDRDFLRKQLTKILNNSTDNSWYSMAAATVAEFWQNDSSPDSLNQAFLFANKGAEKFPKSLGAQRCRDIIKEIKAPSLSLTTMRFDSANKRSLGVNYKNTRKVFFRSYKLDIKEYILNSKNYGLNPDYEVFKKLLSKKATLEWTSALEETSDYKNHWHYVTPPKHENGFYIVVASLDSSFKVAQNLLSGAMMTFGPMVIATKQNSYKGIYEIEAYAGNEGQPLPDVKVEVYKLDYKNKNQLVDKGITNSKGQLEIKPKENNYSYFFLAEHKGQIAYSEFYSNKYTDNGYKPIHTRIYTDRAIYRPMQKVYWKAISYQADAKIVGKFKIIPNRNVDVLLYDLNGQVVETVNAKSDSFGAAWGEFTIPTGRALGNWRIQAGHDTQDIKIEEYKRPTFELSWLEQKAPLRLNHSGEVIGEARYYFGQALNKGKVKYKIEKTVELPWWCYWGFWNFSYLSKSQIVKIGETTVNDDGKFKIEFKPEADSRAAKIEGLKYNYNITVDITDEGGETRSSTKFVSIAQASVEAIWNVPEFNFENKVTEVNLSRQLIAGGPAPGKGKWELSSLKEPDTTVMPAEMKLPSYLKSINHKELKLTGDKQMPRWGANYNWKSIVKDWKSLNVIKAGTLIANEGGQAKLSLPVLKAGAYRLTYKSKDEFGSDIETQTDFFVAGKSYLPKLPLLLFVENQTVKVGENIKLWLPTGLKNQLIIFEVFQDGKQIERRYLKANENSLAIEWLVKEEHRGGIGFVVRLLNDYQLLQMEKSVFIPWDNKEIKIETKTFRDRLKPGQKETWSFILKSSDGKKLKNASAQLLAYMYDRSLDALAPHNSPSLLNIYPYRYATYPAQYILGQGLPAYFEHGMEYNSEYMQPSQDQLNFYASYGVGGPGMRGRGGYDTGGRSAVMRSKGAMLEMESAPAMEMAMAMDDSMANKKQALPASNAPSPNAAAIVNQTPATLGEPTKVLRTNFSETAFFLPHLMNNDKGEVELSFEVPDSVTSWNLWVQAFTKDLMAGALNKQSQSVKDLIVRPYLPRYLREGDLGKIKIVINNTSEKMMIGKLDIEITDEEQKTSLAEKFGLDEAKLKGIPFKLDSKKSTDVEIEVKVPAFIGTINFKAIAKAATSSDGELRALPILPGRFHLAQSRFVSLKDKARREISFSDLAKADDTSLKNEKMVVQVDAQLFYSTLSALPYLINEPYECIEQNLNRFISTGILTSLFNKYPSIENMAKKMSSRKTQLESFNEPNANLKMSMEETPWLIESKGGMGTQDELINILDSSRARHIRNAALSKLEKAQLPDGGFPWFAGGEASPYITLYVLYGFSKALEFGVEVPKPMIQKAWQFMHNHYLTEIVNICMSQDSCWESITFLNYVLSNYPDNTWGNNIFSLAEREKMLEFSFKHWREHSPYLKGYLALTLHRTKKVERAKLVWDSVMDSATYKQDEGTHWQREDRSWLWYNDTVETHAFALRTMLELNSDNQKRDGLVEWLFLNKKLNHWKSTRATAEVIYSLAQYLTKTAQLGQKEAVQIKVGQEKPINLNFSPDEYSGKKNQIVYDGDKVSPKMLPIIFEKETKGFMFASTTWHFSTEKLPAKAEGDFLSVERKYFLRQVQGNQVVLKPLNEGNSVQVGDEVEVQLSIRSKHAVEYVHLRDPRGAGFEPLAVNSKHKWDLGITWYEEVRDSGTNFFFERLPQGEYAFKYRIRATMAGEFQVSPATLQPMYAPEFAAYSSGERLKIK